MSLVISVHSFISCFRILCCRIMFQFLFRVRGSAHTVSFDIKLVRAKSFFCKSSGRDKNYLLMDLAISEIKLQKSKPKAIFLDCIFFRKFWKPSIDTCCLRLDIVQKAVTLFNTDSLIGLVGFHLQLLLINRPGVARAVLQTPL